MNSEDAMPGHLAEKQFLGLARVDIELLLTTGIARALGISALILVSQNLGSHSLGGVVWYLSTTGLISGLAQLGVAPIVAKEIAKMATPTLRRDLSVGFLATSFLCSISISGVIALIQWSSCNYGSCLLNPIFSPLLLTIWGISVTVSSVSQTIFSTQHSKSLSGRFLAIRSLFTTVAIAVASKQHGQQEVFQYITFAEILVASGAIFVIVGTKLKNLRVITSIKAFVSMFRETGLRILGVTVITQLALWIPQTYLAHQPGGLDELGVYGIAARISLVISFIPGVLLSRELPRMSENSNRVPQKWIKEATRVTKRSMKFSAIGFIALIFLIPILQKQTNISQAMFIPVFTCTLFMTFLSSINSLVGVIAISGDLTPEWIVSDLILAVTQVVFGLLLVKEFGAVGLAISGSLAYFASVLYLGLRIRNKVLTCV